MNIFSQLTGAFGNSEVSRKEFNSFAKQHKADMLNFIGEPMEQVNMFNAENSENAETSSHPEQIPYAEFVRKLAKDMHSPILNLLHGAVGVAGEAGELLDAIKKNWVYNKPLDRENILEELGDLRFYMQLIANHMGFTEQMILDGNREKLKQRYASLHYSDMAAQLRADKSGVQRTGETK